MTHGSLFSGIGGFDLAAEWMGWENVFHCEINEFCNKILNHYWPNATSYKDITKTDFSEWRGKVDIVSGGFPCQPYSTAGKRKGKEDDRHLWPEMLRAIREIQPSWVVGENVPGLLNWKGGMVLAEIKTDLESSGFEVFPPCILPACGKNAPHRRDRLWIIAHSESNTRRHEFANEGRKPQTVQEKRFDESVTTSNSFSNGQQRANTIKENDNRGLQERMEERYEPDPLHGDGVIAYCNSKRTQGGQDIGIIEGSGEKRNEQFAGLLFTDWQKFPTQPPICGGNDGIPAELHIINRIENDYKKRDKEGKPEVNYIIWKTMREMWEQREFAETSPELFINQLCNSLSIVPCKSGSIGWIQEGKEAEKLRDMWVCFYAMSYEEAQDLQCKMLEHYRKIERRKKVEQSQRIDRIKALGNSVVPQVVYEIFKAIQKS